MTDATTTTTAAVFEDAASKRAEEDGRAPIIPEAVRRRTHTMDETARVLGVGRTAAYDAARRGEIPTIRVGRRLLVPAAALDRLLTGETGATETVNEAASY